MHKNNKRKEYEDDFGDGLSGARGAVFGVTFSLVFWAIVLWVTYPHWWDALHKAINFLF